MDRVKVSPNQIDNCSRRLDDAGVVWGQSVSSSRPEVTDTSAFGSDMVGNALVGVYQQLAPPVMDYAEETGFCVRETATGLHHMAEAYRETEDNSTEEANRINDVLTSIGAK